MPIAADGHRGVCQVVPAVAAVGIGGQGTMEAAMEKGAMGWVIGVAAVLAGCFGGSGDGAAGAGGSVGGSGGTSAGTGAGTGVLGGNGGTNSVGGAGGSLAGAGGTGVDCGDTPCAFGACEPGYEPYVPPGGCCPTKCVPADPNNACNVDCTVEDCPDGRYVIPQGECCPICVRDSDPDLCGPACPTITCANPVYDPASCCMICPDTSDCAGVTRCMPNADCAGVACCDELGNYFDCYCGNFSCSLNLRCPDGTSYGCAPPTSGAEPPVPPPDVCGCMPECPQGQFLIANAASGTWPDGSQRGTFSCSSTLPP